MRDDELPDWAHTSAVMLVSGAFGAPWLWLGLKAVFTARLPATMGPDFAVWMFGQKTLIGNAAVLGGLTLVNLGLVFLALGVAYTRWAEGRSVVRLLPWALLVLTLLLYRWTVSLP